jgi:hypothetical protein
MILYQTWLCRRYLDNPVPWISKQKTFCRRRSSALRPTPNRAAPVIDKGQSQSYITTDSQSASLSWCQAKIRDRDQFPLLLEIPLSQLRVYYFVAPSLTNGQVCNLLLLLGFASAVPLGSSPARLKTIFY